MRLCILSFFALFTSLVLAADVELLEISSFSADSSHLCSDNWREFDDGEITIEDVEFCFLNGKYDQSFKIGNIRYAVVEHMEKLYLAVIFGDNEDVALIICPSNVYKLPKVSFPKKSPFALLDLPTVQGERPHWVNARRRL